MKNTIKNKQFKIIIFTVILLLISISNSIATVTSIEKSEKILYNINIVENEKKESIMFEQEIMTPLEIIRQQLEQLEQKKEEKIIPTYSQEDLNLLARLIYCEAGSDFISDRQQQLVGMVVINRVNSEYFPNTIQEVIYQKGQYACVGNSIWDNDPPQRCIDNAKLVLEGKVSCPSNVVFQAEFLQGDGIYEEFDNNYTTTYFCFIE